MGLPRSHERGSIEGRLCGHSLDEARHGLRQGNQQLVRAEPRPKEPQRRGGRGLGNYNVYLR